MGRRTIWSSDLPNTKGEYVEVADPDELGKVFVGVGGSVFQLDLTEGEQQAFKKHVQKYIDAAEKADDPQDVKVFLDVFETKDGYRRTQMTAASARTAGTAGSSVISKHSKAELAGKAAGWYFTKSCGEFKQGDQAPEGTKDTKQFVMALGFPAPLRAPSVDTVWEAIDKAIETGVLSQDKPSDD